MTFVDNDTVDDAILNGPVFDNDMCSSSVLIVDVVVYYCLVHFGAVAGPTATVSLFTTG